MRGEAESTVKSYEGKGPAVFRAEYCISVTPDGLLRTQHSGGTEGSATAAGMRNIGRKLVTQPDDIFASLTTDVPREVYVKIDQLFQAWALFEATLTEWLIQLIGADEDVGRLVVDRMDTKLKLNHIKSIYEHVGNEDVSSTAKQLAKRLEQHVKVRNILAHKVRHGMDLSTGDLYFSTGKVSRAGMEMVAINVSDVAKAARFAAAASQQILQSLDALNGSSSKSQE